MGKEHFKDLGVFLESFPEEVQDLAWWLRDSVWNLYPQANELIYDNYNALAFGWSVTERQGHVFCTIAVGRTSHNVHFGFYYGAQLSDPDKMLIGAGSQYRYVLVRDKKSFPKTYLKKLLKEAYANAVGKVKDQKEIRHGLTIVKSISPVKRSKVARKKPAKIARTRQGKNRR